MQYLNTKTGAVIDSPFPIGGDLWIPVDNPNQDVTDLSEQELKVVVIEQQKKIDELEAMIDELEKGSEVANENEEGSEAEHDEDEIDLQSLTNKQLEALAKEQGIELTTEDKKNKDTRIAAIVAVLG